MSESPSTSWLDAHVVESAAPAPSKDKKRGKAMAAKRTKSWDCDGEFVFYRAKLANPAIKQRLADQLAKGELKYMATSDDVQIYAVQKTSPFSRPAMSLQAIDMQTLCREIRLAAVRRQWNVFLDGLEELASRYKNSIMSDGKPPEPGFARQLYQEKLTHIFHMITLAGGPSQQEIDRGVQALRAKRGAANKKILLPA